MGNSPLLRFSFLLFFFSINIFSQWSNNPNTPLIVGYGQDPKMCSDGAGGCYITYTYETTWYPQKLAIERLDRYGYKPWGTKKQIFGELPEQWNPEIIEVGEGNTIVSYDDYFWDGGTNYSIRGRIQKIDSSGNFLWSTTGVRVSLSEVNHGGSYMVPDNEGGVVVSFADNNYDYFVNRINRYGQRVWGDSGLFLVHYAMGGPNNIIRGDDQSYYFFIGKHLIKINPEGEIIRHDTSYALGNPVSDGQNGVVGMYISNQYYPNIQLRAIRIDSSGNNLWEPYVLAAESLYFNPYIRISRNQDYFFFSWIGQKYGINQVSQFQGLRLDGSKLFNESIPLIFCRFIIPSDSLRTIFICNYPDSTIALCFDSSGNQLFADSVTVSKPGFGSGYAYDGNGGFILVGTVNQFTIVVQQVSRNGYLGVVPVELISFTGEPFDNNVILKWQTSSETNNKGFEVETTTQGQLLLNDNGENWRVIGFVNGAGTTAEPQNYYFTHRNLNAGKYKYRLKQIDFDGSFEHSKVIEVSVGQPDNYFLYQNYPNPFNPVTKIRFSLHQDENVRLTLFNTLGEEIQVLIDQNMKAGVHTYILDASSLVSGIYFYRLTADEFLSTKKLILLR